MQRMDGPEQLEKAELLAADRWITDMLTSVFTSRDIPVNTVLGPCDLKHSSLYDSIAFIALKCSDRRTKPYMLKVDLTRTASESPCWLQLVQPARNTDEQNLEAYVKDGQLFFRALRTIRRDSELLVWYKKDLSQLLNLSPEESKGIPPYMCPFCKQTFQFEFPLLAHQRFLCKERFLSLTAERFFKVTPCSKGDKPATDFHNLARDLENDKAPSNNTEKGGHNKRRHSEVEKESRDKILCFSPPRGERSAKTVCLQGRADQLHIPVALRQANSGKHSTISSITESQSSSQESPDGKNKIGSGGLKHLKSKPKIGLMKVSSPLSRTDSGSISDSIRSGDEERKSAFVQPPRSSFQTHPLVMTLPAALPQLPLAASKLQSAALLQAAAHKQLFHASVWPKTLASSPALGKASSISRSSSTAHHSLLSVPLSPLAPLGLPAQNWCAKCSISFHMTSDLVHHMRSHHKRAPSEEEQGATKLQRRDRLRCPICKESFRERHHLSRHMTSHT